jgi:hypothetical protein
MNVERAVLRIERDHRAAAQADQSYWLARTPEERWVAIQQHRIAAYGHDQATGRLQRVLEIAKRG